MADTLQLRFRSTHGDLGPFTFTETQLLQAVKEHLFQSWPKEGDMAKEPPTSPNDIKLILSGKFVDATKPLKDYKKDMGELKPDTIVTMHIVVRIPTNQPKQSGTSSSQHEKEAPKGCCVIS